MLNLEKLEQELIDALDNETKESLLAWFGENDRMLAAGWIPVEEALPELLEYVLVYNTEGATLIARRFPDDWVAFFSDGESKMAELKATHWMPLPSPPASNAHR